MNIGQFDTRLGGKPADRQPVDLLEAYKQGQRDREQGWPVIDWGFTFAASVAYHAGYANPRI